MLHSAVLLKPCMDGLKSVRGRSFLFHAVSPQVVGQFSLFLLLVSSACGIWEFVQYCRGGVSWVL